jgi:very-short-patch-repair endonuclease
MACTNRRDLEMQLIARRQLGLVTRAQLLDAGVTRSAIEHRARTGVLWRVYPGVYAVGRPALTREGRWLAAVLACGNRAALSHLSAAVLWGIEDRRLPSRPTVSVPTDAGRSGPPGVDLHRASSLRPDDVTKRNAVPVTTLPRTLTDLAAVLDDQQLKSALRQAERLHRLDLARFRASLGDFPASSHRHARLRHLLDDYVPARTDSDLEAAFLELCTKHGVPRPETQVPIGPYRADFLWPHAKLVVETDGRDAHDGFVAFREDRVRDRAMKSAGFEVLRFTASEVRRDGQTIVRDVLSALIRRYGERNSQASSSCARPGVQETPTARQSGPS